MKCYPAVLSSQESAREIWQASTRWFQKAGETQHNQNEQMQKYQARPKAFEEKDILPHKPPIHRPLKHKLPSKFERALKIATGVRLQERYRKENLALSVLCAHETPPRTVTDLNTQSQTSQPNASPNIQAQREHHNNRGNQQNQGHLNS